MRVVTVLVAAVALFAGQACGDSIIAGTCQVAHLAARLHGSATVKDALRLSAVGSVADDADESSDADDLELFAGVKACSSGVVATRSGLTRLRAGSLLSADMDGETLTSTPDGDELLKLSVDGPVGVLNGAVTVKSGSSGLMALDATAEDGIASGGSLTDGAVPTERITESETSLTESAGASLAPTSVLAMSGWSR